MRWRTSFPRLLPFVASVLPLLLLCMSAASVQARSIEIPLGLQPTDLHRQDLGGSWRLELPGESMLRETGAPELPVIRRDLLVGRGERVAEVRLEGGRWTAVPLDGPLARRAEVPMPEGPALRETAFEGALAKAATVFPPVVARPGADQVDRGYRVASVEIFPLRWDRSREVVELYVGGRAVVRVEPDPHPPAILDRQREVEGWRDTVAAEVRARVINPEAVDAYDLPALVPASDDASATLRKTPSLSTGPVRHLIITAEALRPQFERLAEHRTRTGLPSLVVTLDEIQSNYRQGVDLAETIRLYIADAYAKWGVDYVVLGGDSDVVPPRYAYSTFYPPGSATEIPADLYYSCLDGNWNADGDALFGEHFATGANPGDLADLTPELSLGRVPVSTLAGAEVYVDKVLAYELPADADYQQNLLFASEVLFPASWSGDESIVLDGAFLSESLLDSVAECETPGALTHTRMYENSTAYPGAQPETKAGVLGALDSGGYGIFNHIGHGFYFNMSVGDGVIVPADADALTNAPNYFLLYSLNCSSSAFDFDCLNERFVENPDGGAVVAVGSSRAAFPNMAKDFQLEFYDALLCQGEVRVGDAVRQSRLPFLDNTFVNTVQRWTELVYTLLGDPAVPIWTRAPRTAVLVPPPSAALGDNELSIVVADSATLTGLGGATVTLTKDGEDYATGTTDSGGLVVLDFAPESLGDITVWVSGADTRPRSDTIPVSDPSLARVSVQSLSFDDDANGASQGNGNGRLEAGERVEITPVALNGATAAYGGGTMVLRVDSPSVTVVDSTVTVPALAGQSSAPASSAFVVDLDTDLGDAEEVDLVFVCDVGASNETRDVERLDFAAPEIEVVRIRVDDSASGNGDGIVGPNETVDLLVEVKNYGSGAVESITGTLSSSAPEVTILDPSASWGAAAGVLSSVENTSDPFQVRESDISGPHPYELSLTDDQGRVRVFDFDLRAPATVFGLEPGAGGAGEIVLQWTPSPAEDLLGYRVYRRAEGEVDFSEATADVAVGTAYFRDAGLPALSRFEYRVAAVDSGGLEGPVSSVLEASTAPPELSCFPLPMGLETSGDLAIGHLDADMVLDMVVPSDLVYVLDGNCTEKLDGDDDAQTFGPISSAGDQFGPASIALANLHPDGGLEIIASSWNTAEVFVFQEDGSVLPGWPVQLNAKNWSTPAVGDLDGDGDLEVVINDTSGFTYAFHHDGSEVADGDANAATTGVIAPRRRIDGKTEFFGRTSPALFDVDGDGELEILFGSKYQASGVDDSFYALKTDGSGANAAGWPKTFAPFSSFLSSPTVADLENDGSMEIIQLCENDSLYVWNPDGSRVAPFPIPMQSDSVNQDSLAPSIAVADFDGDDELEMVVVETFAGSQPTSAVHLIDRQGVDLPGWPVAVDNLSESSPVVGDIDGDSSLDIVFGVGGGSDAQQNFLFAWDVAGQPVKGFPIIINGFVRATPTLCDFDGDGSVNVALASWDRLIHVWDMGAPYDESLMPWPTFRGNVFRNGVADFAVPTAVDDGPARRPQLTQLLPNVPNPFNPVTEIRFDLARDASRVRLQVYDVHGRRVRQLEDGPRSAGRHRVRWNGRDEAGRAVSSGIYYYRLEVDGRVSATRKMVLVK